MNILVIIADDLGWSDVGFRNKDIHTPNIDNIANNYTVFEQFYTQPVCTATRVAIYTGDYPFRHGFHGVIWPWSDYGILKKNTLPNTFKKNNYNTYIVGKWHVGHSKVRYLPNYLGFEYHYGGHTGAMDHWSHKYHEVHDFHENGKPIYPEGHSTDLYANKAVEILKYRKKDKPFLMFVTFNAPHCPLQTHDHFSNKYKFPIMERNLFAGMVTHMDARIGDIIKTLKEENYYDDTIIWFTSDNGGWLEKFASGSNYPFKSGKTTFYEGGIRVTNVAKIPIDNNQAKKTCHAIDIFPTLCELAKIECPKVDGTSILQNTEDRYLYHNFISLENNFVGSIRYKNWKYIKYQKEELYDIDKDKHEKNNLIEKNSAEAIALKTKLKEAAKIYKPCYISWLPPNFKFPEFWGPPIRNCQIKSLEKNNSIPCMSEALGIPPNFLNYHDKIKKK